MKIKLFLNKDVNENANIYFEKAKKLKSKLPGIEKTLTKTKKEIEEFESKKDYHLEKKEKQKKLKEHIKKEWFEKFRHTKTSSGFLVVAGKDAGTNEVLLKKHMEGSDLIIHTEAPGSPFAVIKESREKIPKEDIEEAAQFVCCFSQQWKKGFGTADAFWVFPEQVSKKAQSGEYIAKGAFMIYGQKNIIKNIPLKICMGIEKKKIKTEDEYIEYQEIFSGSEKAAKIYCDNRYVKIEPGNKTYKTLNKEIKKVLKIYEIDELPKYIPNDSKVLKK